MKSRTFPQWITALSFLLITGTTYAQSSRDFEGQWTGYLKVNGIITYNISFATTEVTPKTISGLLGYMSYPVVNKIIKEDNIVLTYDKQKQIAYCNTSIPGGAGKECTGYIILKLSKKNAFVLDCELKLNKDCMAAQMVLQRSGESYDDPDYIEDSTQDTDPAPATTVTSSPAKTQPENKVVAPTAPVQVRKIEADTVIVSAINLKDITHAADKDFKWFEWSKAPEALKKAARNIHTYKNNKTQKDVILYDEIKEYLDDTVGGMIPAHVEIAAIDLNNDGVYGLAVSVSGSMWCGTAGCTFELYENGGLLTVNLGTDYGPSPASNGVKASNSRFFPLVSNSRINVDPKKITELFTYDNVKQKTAVQKEIETGNGTLPELTPPTAASKQFLFKRWKAVEMIGSDHQGFATRTKNGETSEIQFGRDNKCYMYKDGVLGFAIPFILAPDGKSLLLTQPNGSEQMSLQILSLTTSQIIIKGPLFDDNIIVLKAK